MNPYAAERALMQELGVYDGHSASDYRRVYILESFLDACELGMVPDKETKAAYLVYWEEPEEWFDESLFNIPSVENLFGGVRQFAAMEPAVEVSLPSIKELFPNGD